MAGYVSEAVIRRLPDYYRHLRELEIAGETQISSQQLGERMGLTPSQIRQDINCFGGFGRQGIGYEVSKLKGHIAEILGLHNQHRMIIVGVGSIGNAVANYTGFNREGFKTLALFDADESKIGHVVAEHPIRPMSEIEDFLKDNEVDIAVLALPAAVAQEVLDRLVKCGVKGIWNFAPTDLKHPSDVSLVNVHLSSSLEILSYKMAHKDHE